MAINRKEVEDFIGNWTKEVKVNKKPFDEVFQIDGSPLWWFYHRIFVTHVLPKPVNCFAELYENRKLSLKKKILLKAGSIALPFYFRHVEKKKRQYFFEQVRRSKNGIKSKEEQENIKRDKEIQRILFLSYSNHIAQDGTIFRLQSIINKINENKQAKAVPIFAIPFSREDKKILQGRKTIYDFITKENISRAKNDAKRLSEKWNNISVKEKQEMFSFKERSYWRYLKYGLNSFFSKRILFVVALYYYTAIDMIKKEKIQSVLMSSTNGLIDKAMQAAAAKSGKKVYVVQHGIGGFTFDIKTLPNTELLVFSEKFKQNLEKQRVSSDKIHVVGPVVFDKVISYKKPDLNGNREDNSNNNNSISSSNNKSGNGDDDNNSNCKSKERLEIFFATTSAVEEGLLKKEEYFKRVRKIIIQLNQLDNVYLKIKLHPMEKMPEEYKKILREEGVKGEVISDNNRDLFFRNLATCSFFLNFNSTASVEAMILDKAVINVDIFGEGASFTRESGAAIEVRFDEDIMQAAKEALKDTKATQRKRYVTEICGEVDGKSSERIVKILLE